MISFIYKYLLKPIFFSFDPEKVHDAMTFFGVKLGSFSLGRKIARLMFDYQNPSLEQEVLGIHFKNPIGLSAGFDKDGLLIDIIPSVGFGFVEIGSITGEPCKGNPKPRLWRLPEKKSLRVWYGLKSDGCEAVAKRLEGVHSAIPLGMSIAMTNCKDNLDIDRAIEDYAKAFKVMEPHGAYITINISCPNTEGGQPFVEHLYLERLLTKLDAIPTAKPVFIKFSPDLSDEEIDALLDVARAHRVHGIICSNLTKKGVTGDGGLSGMAVQELSDKLLAYIYRKEKSRFVLVGCGGVFSAEDAYRKIRLGASLVQLITGMIFEGPQLIGDINQGLARLLKSDGFTHIKEAIGIDNKNGK